MAHNQLNGGAQQQTQISQMTQIQMAADERAKQFGSLRFSICEI